MAGSPASIERALALPAGQWTSLATGIDTAATARVALPAAIATNAAGAALDVVRFALPRRRAVRAKERL